MTDFKTSDRDVNRAIRSWLHADRHEDASRIAGAVLDQVTATPRRRAGWPAWRTPTMNRIVTLGLGAAALVVVGLLGYQLLGSSSNSGGPGVEPTATPEPSVAESTPPAAAELDGPFILAADEFPITVTFAAPGWFVNDDQEIPAKNGNYSPPDGAYLLGPWHGFDLHIPDDPCEWKSTMPETPATNLDEIVEALARQASRDASEPADVTVGGHSGKSMTLHVPDDIGQTAGEFDCDEGKFCTFGDATDCQMWNAQGPGAIDEVWFVDLDGEIFAMTGAYCPQTPANVVDELRAILASMTFGE